MERPGKTAFMRLSGNFFYFLYYSWDIRKFFADTESDGDRMKKTLLNRKKQIRNLIIMIIIW